MPDRGVPADDESSECGVLRCKLCGALNQADARTIGDDGQSPLGHDDLEGIRTRWRAFSSEQLLALEIQRHGFANEVLQCTFVDLVIFFDVNRTPDLPLEAGVE